MKLRRYIAVLTIALVLAGWSAQAAPGQPAPPTLAEAEGFLSQVVALAQHSDFASLCAVGDLNCESGLDTAGRTNVPSAPPTVIGSRIVPTTRSGDLVSMGGLVLSMCGHDATGALYNSEMLVFRDGPALRAINPVYWGNIGIADGGGDGGTTAASPVPRIAC